MEESRRQLPSVAAVLGSAPELVARFGHARAADAIRAVIADLRGRLAAGEALDGEFEPPLLAAQAAVRLARDDASGLRPVINATGVILHTNLGRAPLAEAAAQAIDAAARGYVNLEIDLADGNRSNRNLTVRHLLTQLTGAASATVVNNCAAATVLTLRALAAGREVVVSRGQLIEIGGSFRLPEIMAASGARLREVGTTNITRLSDYAAAIGPDTALVLRVHPSNYRICGFTETPTLADLVRLGQRHRIPVVDDIGSGAMVDPSRLGFADEPWARASIAAGANLVLFSGDKLLGGPQAGVIVGDAPLIERIERDPLLRAVRLDKLVLAGLAATLRLYQDEMRAPAEVPILRMIRTSTAELRARANAIVARLPRSTQAAIAVGEDEARIGGGSAPEQGLPSVSIKLRPMSLSASEMARRLRAGSPPVMARIQDDEVRLDLRTVFPGQDEALASAIAGAIAGAESP